MTKKSENHDGQYVMDEITARSELERVAAAMDLDLDIDPTLEPKQLKEAEKNLDMIIKNIRLGSIVINDEGEPVFTPRRSKGVDPIHFREPTGATLLAADKFSENERMRKMYAMISEMTEIAPHVLGKLKKSDLYVVLAIGGLFLG